MLKCWHTGSGCQRIRYLLPAAPSVRLVQQPCAEDWVHVDSYALDTNQEDSTWRTETEKCRKTANQRFNSASLKAKSIKALINNQLLQNETGHIRKGHTVQYIDQLFKCTKAVVWQYLSVWSNQYDPDQEMNIDWSSNHLNAQKKNKKRFDVAIISVKYEALWYGSLKSM